MQSTQTSKVQRKGNLPDPRLKTLSLPITHSPHWPRLPRASGIGQPVPAAQQNARHWTLDLEMSIDYFSRPIIQYTPKDPVTIQSSSGIQKHEAVLGTCQDLESFVFLLFYFPISKQSNRFPCGRHLLFEPLSPTSPHFPVSSLRVDPLGFSLSSSYHVYSALPPLFRPLGLLLLLGLHGHLELGSKSMRLNKYKSPRTQFT